MKKSIGHYCLSGIGIMLCIASCGKNYRAQNETQEDSFLIEEDRISPVDTVTDTIKIKAVAPRTTEDALQFIKDSPYRDRFEAGILPQMAVDAPEYAGKLLVNEHDGFLIVDKYTMKLYRYNRYGEEMERVGIACSSKYGSKHKRRDNRTPEGYFTIEGIYDSTDWLYTDDDGKTSDVKGQFGPRFMRLRTPVSSQIGIHGTCAPWSIGGRRSHGCIRMTNENIMRFAEICKPGWPVIVSPGARDMRVNIDEGYDIPSVAVVRGKQKCSPAAPEPEAQPDSHTYESVSPDSALQDTVSRISQDESITNPPTENNDNIGQ